MSQRPNRSVRSPTLPTQRFRLSLSSHVATTASGVPAMQKRCLRSSIHLSADESQVKVYKVPDLSAGSETANRQTEPCSVHSSRLPRTQSPYRDQALQRRRLVYHHGLYSRHVGSNKRQPPAIAYQELSPQRMQSDHELVSRARKWLRRELRVFEFLRASGDLPHSKVEFLLEFIIAILKNMDTQGSAGQAEDMIQEFVGRKNARLLLHELRNWLRSPCETLQVWDYTAQYDSSSSLPSISHMVGHELVEGDNIALKYSEPAEARKPPPSQAWRLYIFKGDEVLETIELRERSVWLLGREERVVDLVTPHPSCSGQHAVLQFRNTAHGYERNEGRKHIEYKSPTCSRLYIVDLLSTHGTSLNGERIERNRYLEIKHKDVLKFGGSQREYIIILPPS